MNRTLLTALATLAIECGLTVAYAELILENWP